MHKTLPYLLAVALAVATCVLGAQLPYFKAQDFYGVLLVMSAGSYLGFAMMDGRVSVLTVELLAALGLAVLVFLGMWWKDVMLAYAFMLHALWHLLHARCKRLAHVTPWYPLSGLLYSLSVGIFIYIDLFH